MTKLIVCEDHADRIGARFTGVKRGRDYTVVYYRHPQSHVTLFAVEVAKTGEITAKYQPVPAVFGIQGKV